MIVDVKKPERPIPDAIAVWRNGKWELVAKAAYLEPYMRKNEETERKFLELRDEFSALRDAFLKMCDRYQETLAELERSKAAINERLAEYHEVLRVLSDG